MCARNEQKCAKQCKIYKKIEKEVKKALKTIKHEKKKKKITNGEDGFFKYLFKRVLNIHHIE